MGGGESDHQTLQILDIVEWPHFLGTFQLNLLFGSSDMLGNLLHVFIFASLSRILSHALTATILKEKAFSLHHPPTTTLSSKSGMLLRL